jgi:hypothetical protein
MNRDTPTQTYFLDLSTLFSILSRQKRTGQLWTKPVRIPSLREPVSIFIEIEAGVLQNCRLLQQNKFVLLEGERAYQMVVKMEAQEWHWFARTTGPQNRSSHPLPTTTQPNMALLPFDSPPNKAVFYPTRTEKVQQRQLLQRLNRQQLHILSLCDGTRSTQRISTMLNISLPDLFHALRELEAQGLIFFQSS